MASPIPGLQPPPSDPLSELATLRAAIASGVTEVRFQDRTVRYASIDQMIKASTYLYQLIYPHGPRTIRCYTTKGL
jgi:hypothetical protein